MYTIESIPGRDKQRDVIVFFLAFGLQDQFLDKNTHDNKIQWSVKADKFQEVLDEYQNKMTRTDKSIMIKPYPPIVKKVCDCTGKPFWTSEYFPEEHGSVVCFLLKNGSGEYWIVKHNNVYAFYSGGPHIIQHFRNIGLMVTRIRQGKKPVLDPSSWGASGDTLRKVHKLNKNHPVYDGFSTSFLHKLSILNQIIPRSDPPQHDDIKCPDCGKFYTRGFRLDDETFKMTVNESGKGREKKLKDFVANYKTKLGDNIAFITPIQDQPRTCCVAFWRRLRSHVLHRHGSLIYALLLVKGEMGALANLPWSVIREWATFHAHPDKLLHVNWSPARERGWDDREDPKNQSPFHAHRIWLGLLPLPMPSDKAEEFPAKSLLEYMLSRADLITHHIDTMLSEPEELQNITKVFPYVQLLKADYNFIIHLDPKAFPIAKSTGTGEGRLETDHESEIYGSSTKLWEEYMVTVFPLIRAIFGACGYRLINPCQLPDEVIAGHRWEMYPVFGHEPRFGIEPIHPDSPEWWAYTGYRLFKDNALLLQLLTRMAIFFNTWQYGPPFVAIARIFKDAQTFADKFFGADKTKKHPLLKFGRGLKDHTFLLEYVKIQPFSNEDLKVVTLSDTSLKDAPPGLFDDGFGFLETMRRGTLLSPNDTDVSAVLSSGAITEFDVIAPESGASFLFNKKDSINLALFIPPKHFSLWVHGTTNDPSLDAKWYRRLANGVCRAGHIDLFRSLRLKEREKGFFRLQASARDLIEKHTKAIEAGAEHKDVVDKYNTTTTLRGIDPMLMRTEGDRVLEWPGTDLASFMPLFRRASALLRDIQQANVTLFPLTAIMHLFIRGVWCPSFENAMPLSPFMASEARKNDEFMSLLWQNLSTLVRLAYGTGIGNVDQMGKVVFRFPSTGDITELLFQRQILSSATIFPWDRFSIETISSAPLLTWIRDNWESLVTKSPPKYKKLVNMKDRLRFQNVDVISIVTTDVDLTVFLEIAYLMEYALWSYGRIARIIVPDTEETGGMPFATISLALKEGTFKFSVKVQNDTKEFESRPGEDEETTIMDIVSHLSKMLDERDSRAPS